ncbi:MAG: M48 family metallopeptidase [Saprospiraceae bacterium]|nr:M48 family metallopeptidase [Saprospiraceae bacterium]
MKNIKYTLLLFVLIYYTSCREPKNQEIIAMPQQETKYFLDIDIRPDLDNIGCGHKLDDDVADLVNTLVKKSESDLKIEPSILVDYFHERKPFKTIKATDKLQQMYETIVTANDLQAELDENIYIIDEDWVNACCMLNRIYVSRGLLNRITDDAQLALIIGHEIAHYILHYQRSYALMNNLYLIKNNQANAGIKVATFFGGSIAHFLRFSNQSDELEADLSGLYICNKAGYDLENGLTAFSEILYQHMPIDLMDQLKFDFNSTHPGSDDRIRCMNFFIEPAKCEIKLEKLNEIQKRGKMIASGDILSHPHLKAAKIGKLTGDCLVGYSMMSQGEEWYYIKGGVFVGWVMADYIDIN